MLTLVTENFGDSYYLLSQKDEELLQAMLGFLLNCERFGKQYAIIVPTNDKCQTNVLQTNEFVISEDADTTYIYDIENICLPEITVPEGFKVTTQKEYLNASKAELLRFYAFNPDGVYNEVIDYGYKFGRANPILRPELSIILLNEEGEPISTCMGYWDEKNRFMEVEVVATKQEYENRGCAKLVISECIKRGISKGVTRFSISAWEDKTKKIYASFGKASISQKLHYRIKV